MESAAHYWLALYTRLRKEGSQVVILNPIQTDATREMLMEDNKTDEIDTLVIAETIRFGQNKASRVPQEKLLALRELCQNRFYLIDMGSDLKRKITALLGQVFPEFESQFNAVFGKTAYEKKSEEGLRCMNIIGHVSKKMTSVIFAVMRDNKLYEPVLPAA